MVITKFYCLHNNDCTGYFFGKNHDIAARKACVTILRNNYNSELNKKITFQIIKVENNQEIIHTYEGYKMKLEKPRIIDLGIKNIILNHDFIVNKISCKNVNLDKTKTNYGEHI